MSRELLEYLAEGLAWPELADELRRPSTWLKAALAAAVAFGMTALWALSCG